jgi:hypothetical protein
LQPDRIYVTRSDGSEATWSFPAYGDGLPHDLVHLVVESAFGLKRGFWGRVDEGADPGMISAMANRIGGKNKYAAFGEDQSELILAEALAAPTTWNLGDFAAAFSATCEHMGIASTAEFDPARITLARDILSHLSNRWRNLLPKGALNASFNRADPKAGTEALLLAS